MVFPYEYADGQPFEPAPRIPVDGVKMTEAWDAGVADYFPVCDDIELSPDGEELRNSRSNLQKLIQAGKTVSHFTVGDSRVLVHFADGGHYIAHGFAVGLDTDEKVIEFAKFVALDCKLGSLDDWLFDLRGPRDGWTGQILAAPLLKTHRA